jgi:hypothetical protein
MVNFTSPLMPKKLESKDLNHPYPSKTLQFFMTDLFHWPSLSELSNGLFPFHWLSKEEHRKYFDGNLVSSLPVMRIRPPPSAPTYNTYNIPPISSLTTAIIRSVDKLFFISDPIGSNCVLSCLADLKETRMV